MTAQGSRVCSVEFRVRFDEAGPDGLLRTSSVLRYAQDLASFHSAALGFDRAWYAERGLAWLARTATVAILAPIAHGSSMTGTTQVVGERRVWARRRTDFVDGAGQVVAWTHVDWVLADARGAPTRIPPEFEVAFGTPRATFPLGRVDLGPPPADALTTGFAVRPQELDPMDHVNNAVYADWLEEATTAPPLTQFVCSALPSRGVPGRPGSARRSRLGLQRRCGDRRGGAQPGRLARRALGHGAQRRVLAGPVGDRDELVDEPGRWGAGPGHQLGPHQHSVHGRAGQLGDPVLVEIPGHDDHRSRLRTERIEQLPGASTSR